METLTLSRSGQAKYEGNAFVPLIGNHHGEIGKEAFEKLALSLMSQGYFQLESEYGQENIDVSHTVIHLKTNGQVKSVTSHSIGASPKVALMAKEIGKIYHSVNWLPVTTGIVGAITKTALQSKSTKEDEKANLKITPLSSQMVFIRLKEGGQEYSITTDERGKFRIALPPGIYAVRIDYVVWVKQSLQNKSLKRYVEVKNGAASTFMLTVTQSHSAGCD